MVKLVSRVPAIIPIADSLSAAVALGDMIPSVIQMSSVWTDACISFMCTSDDTNWFDLMTEKGQELIMAADGGQRIMLPSGLFACHTQIRVRSGTTWFPVLQVAERTLYLELWK
jgi:hypothetical protein